MVLPTRLRVIAYYFSGSARLEPPYCIADIPADRLTHVNYAFADVSADTGEISLGRSGTDRLVSVYERMPWPMGKPGLLEETVE